jgi:hypothetical protein
VGDGAVSEGDRAVGEGDGAVGKGDGEYVGAEVLHSAAASTRSITAVGAVILITSTTELQKECLPTKDTPSYSVT